MSIFDKYKIKLDFSDYSITLNDITINIKGEIVIRINKIRYVGLNKKLLKTFATLVYADFTPIIVNNRKNPKEIKKLLIEHLKTYKDDNYEIISFRIDDVFDVKKRERKLKLDELERKNNG